jgi:hypothetical protein
MANEIVRPFTTDADEISVSLPIGFRETFGREQHSLARTTLLVSCNFYALSTRTSTVTAVRG